MNLHAQEIDLGLERIRQVAERMKLLRPAPLVITVAGTNGKGSSVAMLVSILREAGYQVGSYTSPHIQRFNERIQINGQPVEDKAIVQAFDTIETARKLPLEETKLTYFEFSTLAALSIFKQAALDVVVLEVGLGGRLDAVNIIDADGVLITAIDVDHIDWLGDDRSQIAIEKAGVMRSGKIAVCSDAMPPESLGNFATEHQVPLFQLGQDFQYQSGLSVINQTADYWVWQWLSPQSLEGSHSHTSRCEESIESSIELPVPSLLGAFQLQNASGVVALLFTLWQSNQFPYPLPFSKFVDSIKKGLVNAFHPGRLQKQYWNKQLWLVDVAHNPQSAKVLAEYLKATELQGFTAVFSVLSDKDALPMVRSLSPYVKHWLIADLRIPRALEEEGLRALLLQAGVPDSAIQVFDKIETAVEFSFKEACNKLVFGSFFTVSQAFDALDTLESSGKISRSGVERASEFA